MIHRLSLILFISSTCLGLLLRKSGWFPIDFIHPSFGDILWGVMTTALARLLLQKSTLTMAVITSIAFNVAIECSQLFHNPFMDGLRSIPGLGFVLGSSFLWSDIAAYLIGVVPQVLIEMFIQQKES
ncbi:MAG: DUF2809 domain-containing protein [Bacteroidia bacterium]|nr:DUF2809 domain-containing protein [Bacteroidia bacterium]